MDVDSEHLGTVDDSVLYEQDEHDLSSAVWDGKMDFGLEQPGPVDDSVLYEQDKHVSSAVWDGQERGVLRCHEHTVKIDKWLLTNEQLELVEKAGFGHLRSVPSMNLDNSLISALVERWRRETNTFHLTVGEMTITLEDVAFILGLAIDGKPVTGTTYTTCDSICMKLLGKKPGPEHSKGGMVKLTWLVEAFSKCPEDAPMEHIQQCTRAYLLYLIGSTIFCTTSGNTVAVMYLQLFEKFDEIKTYAWGAAALSYLYRALGNACLRGQSTISGSLTLLQCWSFEHLKVGRPNLVMEAPYFFPLALKWKGRRNFPPHNHDLAFYRKALDYLDSSDVTWLPYDNIDDMIVPEDVKQNIIVGRSTTMLICFDKAERHLPERCLRQYGMQQHIPENVKSWQRKSRGVDGNIDLSKKMQKEINEWLDRQQHIVQGGLQNHGDSYMQWYLKITRRFVGRPKPLSSEFNKMSCALKEIACIVNDFSTEGMNSQQMQLIVKIKEVLCGCLEDSNEFTMHTIPQSKSGKREKRKKQEKGSGRGRVTGGGIDNVDMEQPIGMQVGGEVGMQVGIMSQASDLEIQVGGSLDSMNDEQSLGKAIEAVDFEVLVEGSLDAANDEQSLGKAIEAVDSEVLVEGSLDETKEKVIKFIENSLSSPPPSAPPAQIPLSWPPDCNLTIDWIQDLMCTLEWSSRNLAPSEFPHVLPISVLDELVNCASKILHGEPNYISIESCRPASRVVVVGDVHGQLHDVLFLLHDAGFPAENQFYVFNGNYVDRGAWGLETFLILLAWKVFMPQRVYLLRGNHESKLCTSIYGFEKEVMTKYGNQGSHVYHECLECFKVLPLASVIAGCVYTAHGGLFRSVAVMPSKKLRGKKKRRIDVDLEANSLSLGSLEELLKAKRSVLDLPSEGSNLIPGDVLWSNPSMSPGLLPKKEGGIGLLWGPDCTEEFLKKFHLKLIIRSHEGPDARKKRPHLVGMDEGYTIDHVVESGQLITLFSAPDYPQFQATEERYNNKGAYILLEPPGFDTPLFRSFEAITPRPKVDPYYNYENVIDSDEEFGLESTVLK